MHSSKVGFMRYLLRRVDLPVVQAGKGTTGQDFERFQEKYYFFVRYFGTTDLRQANGQNRVVGRQA